MLSKQEAEGPAEPRSIWKVAARVPWPAVLSVCLYLPGIVLWSVYSLRCKASTFVFLSTVAPVSPETVDAVTSTVNTTLITLAAGGTFIFALLLVLAIARSIQVAGVAPNACCPCARPTPSSFYMYRIFNLGFNIIVLFVDMAIILLMMGAFLWLVIAFAANVSMKFGVRDAKASGIDPLQQFNIANQNYSTVVSYYQQQLRATPPCVVNTTWFKGLNSSISSILAPVPDASSGSNTLLCPQSCLNLGSFATLFKLSSNCICDQEQLYRLQDYSMTVSTEAGVALCGSILIYLACTCLHAYLTGQYVHAGYDYRAAKQRYADLARQRRRRRQGHTSGGTGGSKGGLGSGGGNPAPYAAPGNIGSSDLGLQRDDHSGSNGYAGSRPEHHANGWHQSGLGQAQYDPESDVGGVHGADDVEMGGRGDSGSSGLGKSAAAAAVAAGVSALAPNGSDGLACSYNAGAYDADQQHDSRQASSTRGGSAAKQLQQLQSSSSSSRSDHAQFYSAASHSMRSHSRQSSGGSSAVWSSDNAAGHGAQRSFSADSGCGAGSVAARAESAGSQLGQPGSHAASTAAGQTLLDGVSPAEAPVGLSSVDEQQQQQQQQQSGHEAQLAAAAAAGLGRGAVHSSSLHSRNASRSSTGSIKEIQLGRTSLDQPAAAHAGATSRAAAADMLGLSNGGSNSEQGQLLPRDSREGRAHHKPSSSSGGSGSYESVVFHSPRASDCGGAASPAAAGAALAGAAAAAGTLDLSPAGLKCMQQQQHERSWQHPEGVWSLLSSADPSVTTAEPAADAAADPAAGSFYSSYNSSGSPGNASGSQPGLSPARRSQQSHRRLPAFDLTSLPTNFLTVEGLEEQQQLARSAANTRPCSPSATASPAAAGGGGGGASSSAGGLAGAAAAVLAAAAAPGRDGGEEQAPQQPSAAAERAVPPGAQQQQQQRGLSARRNISAPAQLELPEQDEPHSAAAAAALPQPQQQQQQRSLLASPLLPLEAQQLLLQHQQQQLALLLQQDVQQWQQLSPLPGHHRQWSTPTSSFGAASRSSSPANFLLQQQYGQHHQHHHSAPAVDPNGALAPFSSFGVGNVSAALQRDALYLQQQQQQQQQQGFMAGAADNASPAGSCGILLYATPSGSPAHVINSTPAGTPRPPAAGLGSLLPPVSSMMFRQQQQQQLMLPPLYGGVSAGYTASSNANNANAYQGVQGAQSSASSSPTPQSVSFAGISGSRVTPSPVSAGMLLSSSAGSNLGLAGFGSNLPPTIPESYSSDAVLEQQGPGSLAGSSSSGMGGGSDYSVAAAAAGQGDVANGSPLERRRSGYRSSLRKGLMAYDQYKHRQRYQEQVTQPLDPRTEISRRYRNRVPAI